MCNHMIRYVMICEARGHGGVLEQGSDRLAETQRKEQPAWRSRHHLHIIAAHGNPRGWRRQHLHIIAVEGNPPDHAVLEPTGGNPMSIPLDAISSLIDYVNVLPPV